MKLGEEMLLENIAAVRTGVVTTRKRSSEEEMPRYKYKALNLRCAQQAGYFDMQYAEEIATTEELKDVYFTRKNDILVRLSAPYTTILITNDKWCGYLVPSHFAIIRIMDTTFLPEYILWLLKQDATKQRILQNISGNGAFGTINSKFFNSIHVHDIPIEKQRILGRMLLLSEEEQRLLYELALQKENYNRLLLENVFDSMKRGN